MAEIRKPCANAAIHPAHQWYPPDVTSVMDVPVKCPGIGRPTGEQRPLNMGRIMQEAARHLRPDEPIPSSEVIKLRDEHQRQAGELSRALERAQRLSERINELYELRYERDLQHSAQVRGLRKRIKNLKARITAADKVLVWDSRTSEENHARALMMRERLRQRAREAEERATVAQDQLDDALAKLEEVRDYATLRLTLDDTTGRHLLKIVDEEAPRV